jgi:Glu-tRNA(Gln) amidotransferase subunit E-like FAD-binding protein
MGLGGPLKGITEIPKSVEREIEGPRLLVQIRNKTRGRRGRLSEESDLVDVSSLLSRIGR